MKKVIGRKKDSHAELLLGYNRNTV